jgi:L-iditol 2-dehydrogenase
MCEVDDVYGFQRQVAEGGMADSQRLSARAVIHTIPEHISFEDAAVTEPLSCAIHAVNRGDIQLDDVVVIAGAGTLGLLMVQVAHLKTPKKLIVIDLSDQRLQLAREYGADIVINPGREDAQKIVREATGQYGCDVYIETTGAPAGVTQGLDMIRKLGRFVEFSVFGRDTTVDWSIIGEEKELDLRGAHLSGDCYPIAIDLLARGLVTSRGIVTHNYALSEWEAAIKMADSMDSIKVLLKP